VVLAAGRPTFRKARKVGHPRFFSAPVKGNPRETYSPEIGATRRSDWEEVRPLQQVLKVKIDGAPRKREATLESAVWQAGHPSAIAQGRLSRKA
jgi:hypothetical protein